MRTIRYSGSAFPGGPVTESVYEIVTGPFVEPQSGDEYVVCLDNVPHYMPPHRRLMRLLNLTFCREQYGAVIERSGTDE